MKGIVKLIVDELKKAAKSELKIYGGARANGKSILLGYQKGLEDAVYIVNQVAKEYNNGWIPCDEQSEPKEDGTYLVSGRWLKSGRNVVGEAEYFGEWKIVNNFIIEAWQPMPEPYKKVGESNAESSTRIQE